MFLVWYDIMERRNKNLFMGIDLGGRNKKTTGICILEEKNGQVVPKTDWCQGCCVIFGKDIIKKIKPYLQDTAVVAIDGPLSFGPGKGKMRLYEKFLSKSPFRKANIAPLPPILMEKFVGEGINLVKNFKELKFSRDINLIEVFPKASLAFCGGEEKFVENIQKIFYVEIEIPRCEVSHQKSAFICALLSFLHAKGQTRYLGYKNGFLFLPSFDFWTKKWQDKFRQTWEEKDYLKYRRLKTNIFTS